MFVDRSRNDQGCRVCAFVPLRVAPAVAATMTVYRGPIIPRVGELSRGIVDVGFPVRRGGMMRPSEGCDGAAGPGFESAQSVPQQTLADLTAGPTRNCYDLYLCI